MSNGSLRGTFVQGMGIRFSAPVNLRILGPPLSLYASHLRTMKSGNVGGALGKWNLQLKFSALAVAKVTSSDEFTGLPFIQTSIELSGS